MGIKSTRKIKRATALEIVKDKMHLLTNEDLEEIVETIAERDGDRFTNFIVNDTFDISKYD